MANIGHKIFDDMSRDQVRFKRSPDSWNGVRFLPLFLYFEIVIIVRYGNSRFFVCLLLTTFAKCVILHMTASLAITMAVDEKYLTLDLGISARKCQRFVLKFKLLFLKGWDIKNRALKGEKRYYIGVIILKSRLKGRRYLN